MKSNVDPRLFFLMRCVGEVAEKRFNNMPIRMLDVGCSDGSFMTIVNKYLSNVECIDGVDVPSAWFNPNSRKQIAGNTKKYVQDLQKGTGEVPHKHYHIITLWEVIEHIENIYKFLHNVKKLMVQDGIVLLSTPNLLGLSRFIKRKQWVGIAEKDHKFLFDKLSLLLILNRAGFTNTEVVSYFFPSIRKKLYWINKSLTFMPGGGMLFAKANLTP